MTHTCYVLHSVHCLQAIIRWFPKYNIDSVDAIILTHGHADAMFGLDDIRSVQPTWKNGHDESQSKPTVVHLSKDCHGVVSYTFPYLVPKEVVRKEEKDVGVKRHVASLDFKIFDYHSKFDAAGLEVLALPVMHGEDLVSSAFVFGVESRVVYISDISRMLPGTLERIKEKPVDILIVDALCLTFKHPTHFSLEQAIDLCREVKPNKAYFVGMGTQFDHDEVNSYLSKRSVKENIDMQLAHDGLCIPICL